ncbi:endonuclease/exonuclease/phosphatase family protein [Modestobacter altitudinis]|uniref:endonuclease/exonuclease/phosphatase family protein n=1 Tax=Modestobacter altitudinis TaxID=2213158 RepID=UPI00110CF2CF|nr:endonuclease/exonuclease/phosphatase family protein [Modestobacter altitudinis]
MPLTRRAALVLAAPWAGWAAVRATGSDHGFPLVPATAFTRYAAGTSVLPVVAGVLARSRSATWLAAGAAAVLGGSVLAGVRRTPGGPTDGRALRLVSLNMLHGRADPAAVVALVRSIDADVLALAEVTPAAVSGLLAAGVAGRLPHAHVVPAGAGQPAGAGGALWTRLEVRERSVAPGRFGQPSARLAVPGGRDLEVTAVHTHPPTTSAGQVARWEDDLELLPDPAAGVLRVLAGDFNATPDHGAFRRLLRRGWVDAARVTGQAMRPTWSPVRVPVPRLTLDHVLVDPRIGVVSLAVVHVPGTDHRALVADLRLPPG